MTVLLPPAGRLTARPACCTAGSAASASCTWLTCPASTCCHTAPSPKWKEPRRDRAGALPPSLGQLRASGAAWEFEQRQGIVVDELIAAATAIGEAHPDETLAIFVGSSSPATTAWSVRSRSAWPATRRCRYVIGGGRLGRLAYTGRVWPHCVAGPVQAARRAGLVYALQDTFTERTCGPASCTLSTRSPSEVHRYDAETPRKVGRAGREARRIM
jgi:hypothetical protein